MLFHSDYNGPFHECAHQFMFVKNLSELCYNTTMNGGEKYLHYILNQNRQVRTAVFESDKGYTLFYTFETVPQDLFDLKKEVEFMRSRVTA